MANKNIRKSLKNLIFNDRYLIIVSVLLAIIVWIVTSINIGDVETKTIKVQAPVKLGDQVSEQLSMQYYSLQDTIDLSVTISGAKYVIGQVDENDLKVVFDTSAVSRTGEQTIPILVSNNSKLDFTVTSTYPSSIQAFFDVNMTKTFDVEMDYEDNVAEGYTFGEPVLSEDKIIVNGPQTYVDQIERAYISVDFGDNKDLTEPFKSKSKIELDGIGIEANYLTITSRTDTKTPISSISYTIPVLKIVTLPVSVNLEDAPEGVDEGSITVNYSQSSIEAGVLDSADITKAVIGTINFNKVSTGKNTFTFDVTNLKGITVLDEKVKTITATVNVSSSYSLKTIGIRRSDVIVEGLGDNQSANVRNLSKYYVNVVVPSNVSTSSLELELKVDVSEKSDDGTYPLTVTILNNDDAWVYSTYTATVDISQAG